MVVMSIPIPGRRGWLAFISREGNYLNLYNNFTLFTVLCLITYHNCLSLTSVFFCLQLEMIFKVVAWVILESYSVFSGCLTCIHVYRRYTCYSTSVEFSAVDMSFYYREVSAKNRKEQRKNYFFSPTRVTRQLQLIRNASIDVQ